MFVKNKKRTSTVKVLIMIIGLIIILLLTGCITSSTDNLLIKLKLSRLAKILKKPLKRKM
jgi:hypothetical protein